VTVRPRSFRRKHIFAWLAAAILQLPGTFALMLAPPNRFFGNPVSWRLAVYLGAADLLALLPGVTTLALAFGVSYSQDIYSFLPDDGHTFFNIVTWGAPPLDFTRQLWIFGGMAAWCFTLTAGGITWKRWRDAETEDKDFGQSRGARRWLAIDAAFILGLTAAILCTKVLDRIAEGLPPYNIHKIEAASTSPHDRLMALWTLARRDSPDATAALQHVEKTQPYPVNVIAAAYLLQRNDLSGLSLVENALQHDPSVFTSNVCMADIGMGLEQIKDPRTIPTLNRILSLPDPAIRRAVALTLGNMRNPAAINPLIRGLEDTDAEVRYCSVSGLIATVGDGRFVSKGNYLINEPTYLDPWRKWAKARSAKP
jgi:hypothetical protein